MRVVMVFVLLAAAVAAPAHAKGDLADFARVQKSCVQVGQVTFGQNGQRAGCRLVRFYWFATVDPLDFYQAEYCLGGEGEACERRALLLFANRAYHPVARLVLERIDPGETQYDDPLVVQSGKDTILVISAAAPGAAGTRSHYLWQRNRWVPIEAQAWLRELPRRLPRGTSLRPGVTPDAETMSARAPLYRAGDADCCPSGGVADIELGLAKGRFTVKKVAVAAIGE